ncbi:MAG TPA: RDD family protein, partial [Sporichthya sp.]|nr:RDD family protein [Sporichthya sp.]
MSAWGPGTPGWGPSPPAPVPGARDVVTGEAVALELRLAKVPSRALALFIDLALMAIPLFGVGVLAAVAASSTDAALGAAILLVSLVSVVIGYPVLFETLSRGRSPGKATMGLRVVRDDGGPVRFRHALTRALVGVLVDFNPLLVGAVGVLVSLASAKGKRVGDMLAGTVVIRERVPKSTAAPAVMPPHLAGWAATLPVSRLPDTLALEARQV